MRVSNGTAGSVHSQPEAVARLRSGQPKRHEVVRLMELVVSRENMTQVYARVVGNKGAAGIDKMSVADLKPFLVEHWPRVREELLAGRYQPRAVRGVNPHVRFDERGGNGVMVPVEPQATAPLLDSTSPHISH